jgi:hypothetical protein
VRGEPSVQDIAAGVDAELEEVLERTK